MATHDRQDVARLAVHAEMSRRGWNIAQLRQATADENGKLVDQGTLGDFLAGQRWPRSKTVGALERALDWPAGTVARILAGDEPPATQTVGGPTQDAGYVKAPGASGEGGASNDEVLEAVRAMRAELQELRQAVKRLEDG